MAMELDNYVPLELFSNTVKLVEPGSLIDVDC